MWFRETEEVRLSREELYELVWTTPISRLVADFTITDVALAKWCKKLNIPRPGVGYWARVQAGQKIEQKRLPRATKDTPTAIFIHKKVRPPEGEPQVEPAFESISVPTSLEDPHPLVRKTRTKLRRERVEDGIVANSWDECAAIYVSRANVTRALCLLEAVVGAVEKVGWEVTSGRSVRTGIKADGAVVPIVIEEMRSWDGANQRLVPKGLLRIELARDCAMTHGVRRVFKDGKVQRLEDMLHLVCLGIWRCAQGIKAWQARRDAWDREFEESQRAYAAERARRELEQARQADLDRRLALLGRSRDIRALITLQTKAQGAADTAADSHAWLEWLQAQAAECEQRAVTWRPITTEASESG